MKPFPNFCYFSIFIGTIFSFFYSSDYDNSHPEWILSKELEGIQVFTKEVEDSNLKEIKIEMWFEDTQLSDIISILNKGVLYEDWMYKCMLAEEVKWISTTEKIDYFQLDFPWPLSNRDIYSYSKSSQDPETYVLTIESEVDLTYPEREDFVRITKTNTKWYFYPKENGDIFMDYYTAPDPGGSIPDWMVNLVIDKGPTKTMYQLRELVNEKKGTFPKIDWIKEVPRQ